MNILGFGILDHRGRSNEQKIFINLFLFLFLWEKAGKRWQMLGIGTP